jgi:hypothetical protein
MNNSYRKIIVLCKKSHIVSAQDQEEANLA